MTDEHRMEQLSRPYVQAVAATCGCRWGIPVPDYGIDLTLRRIRWQSDHYGEVGMLLSLQLKSTARPAGVTADHVVYDLDVTTYNRLRRATRTLPTLLILLVLSGERTEWIDQTEDRLELRGCAYWTSLRRRPPVPNVSTVRIQIPRQNQFTPGQLERIMEAIQRKEDLQ